MKKKPKRSLRTIIIVWFILFSVVPLAFVTGYSLLKFEKAIDHELSQRLTANGRELNSKIQDIKQNLQQKRDRYFKETAFIYQVNVSDSVNLKNWSSNTLKTDNYASLSIFDREGKMLSSVFKDEKEVLRSFVPNQDAVFLSAKYIAELAEAKDVGSIEFTDSEKIHLILISKIQNNNGKTIGFLEQVFDLNREYLQRLKANLKVDVMLFKENAQVAMATQPDFLLYKPNFFRKFLVEEGFFDLSERGGNPIGFLVYPLGWGDYRLYAAVGTSKSESKSVLKAVNIAFVSVVAVVMLLLVTTIFLSSNWFLRPINYLVDALQSFETQEQAVTIPVQDNTEIGLLTESFNEMSKKIWQARSDLEKKVKELESANSEITETQTKLIHSAKMISLGQLVAGVAHELNNPIGFIYSNMNHLREYSESLIKAVKIAQDHPEQLEKFKEEIEFDYIIKDLPKLISSCQDGAYRVRDIVLGLRNFSRLEESKLQEVDIHKALDTTLDLLQGEIKGRIEVTKSYSEIPFIFGYATQVNQVLMNILSNALQAIEGPGQIWITTSKLVLRKDLRPELQNGGVVISIQDSGKGMSPDTVGKIFDPFFTTKGVGQGTGLGLSITYGIIENHGGEINVKSQLGVGTEFILTFPIRPKTDT